MNLFTELKRRNVLKVCIAYIVAAWILVQVVNNIVAPLHLPDWTPTFVIVLLGVGFPIALIIAWAFEMTPQGVKRTETDAKADAETKTASAEPASVAKPSIGPAVSATPSIAVLPFVDMSPGKDQEYFSDGLSEELLNKLAGLKGLRVAGRTSSFYFKDKNESLRTVGETLGVAHILEGSVRKAGDKVRITAQLINAADDYHLWSQAYDRELDDIFAVQDEIAIAVTNALEVTLGVGGLGRSPGMTRNVQAYDEFLRGKAIDPSVASADDIRAAIGRFERAVAIDPNFATAWLRLAYIYRMADVGALSTKIENAAARSDEAFERAKKLTPDSPALLVMEGDGEMWRANWQGADRLYQSALSAAAGNEAIEGRPGQAYGNFLGAVGRIDEALGYLERARAIDPLDTNLASRIAELYAATGNFAAAFAEIDRGMASADDQQNLRGAGLVTALASGDRSEVEKRLKLVSAYDTSIKLITVINAKMGQLLDDREAALEELRRLEADPATRTPIVRGAVLVQWTAYFGDPDFALELYRSLPMSVQRPFIFIVWRRVFRGVRKLPAFKDLLRDVGLVDYWRATGKWADFCHPVGDDDFECE